MSADPGTYRVDEQNPPPAEQALRQEVDALRAHVQELRARLAAAERPASTLRLALAVPSELWRRVRERIARPLRSAVPRLRPGRPANADTGFRPYQVRIPKPTTPMRPRIVHFTGNFQTGGSAQLIVDLVERLGHAYEHVIVSKSLPTHPTYAGLHVHDGRRLRRPESVLRLFRNLSPELVHVHYLFNTRSEQSWRWYHGVFQGIEAFGGKAIENVNILTDPYVSPAVRRYVYVSRYLERQFGHGDAPNTVIYPGSDLAHFSRPAGEVPATDCIGMVYRLDPGKLNERAIVPFIETVRRRPGTKALIVGGGSFLDPYQAAVREAGLQDSFTFTGYVAYEDLPDLLRRMTIFVAPVEGESFGQVTPFAMGMRLPVAAYDVGALPEIVGSHGVLAPAGDAMQLASSIVALLDDRARCVSIGEYNRERAERLFSVETMIERYDELYADVLGV